jgi:hypothetical protein
VCGALKRELIGYLELAARVSKASLGKLLTEIQQEGTGRPKRSVKRSPAQQPFPKARRM